MTHITRLVVAVALVARASAAGQNGTPIASDAPDDLLTASAGISTPFDGPSAPVPPAVIARDSTGRATVRAIRITTPPRLDGQLDDAIYSQVPPMSDFIQMEPKDGAPASERTDVWVFFDGDLIYISFRCFETQPKRIVANEMRRDHSNISKDDAVQFVFDTFYDRRNAFFFGVNAIGGLTDGQLTDERQWNMDLNPLWTAAVGRFEGGWAAEATVPFKSLRYRPGRAQLWGFNAQRINRWKNEVSFLTRVPTTLTGTSGIARISRAATLVGLEVPPSSMNLEIKPYVASALSTDRHATPRISNDLDGDVGVDVRYGITRSIKAELTYNTDFAQVEADEQQVNLTRFSLFFPEKREFFLENRGTFAFGGAGGGSSGSDTPVLFYSRRIGLHDGREVPIRAGGRATGRVRRYEFGAVHIQTDDEPTSGTPPTTFSIVRVKRDVLRRSSVGAIVTRRSVGLISPGPNEAYGLDGTFAFFDHLAINTYWARTRSDGVSSDDTSYRGQLDYSGDRYGVQLERLRVGDHFNPEVGYVRRDDVRRSFGQFRFSPRSRRITSVRKFSSVTSIVYIENGAGALETRERNSEFAIDFQNSDRFWVSYGDMLDAVMRPFNVANRATVPAGVYNFATGEIGFTFGQQRRLSTAVSAEHGTFYGGHKSALAISRGRMEMAPRFSIEPNWSVNWLDLPQGAFTTQLVGSRITYSLSPRMFVSALLQYNSSTNAVSTNVRLRWEYQPGSELFVTYNDERDTLTRRYPDLETRAVMMKLTRLIRF